MYGSNGHLLVEQAGAEWSADETGVGRQVIVSADRKIVTKTTRGWGERVHGMMFKILDKHGF